jgi:hypothetical protein
MSDKYWILGLLIILAVTLFAMFTLPLMMTVYGETEKECVKFNGSELIKLESDKRHGCDWLVQIILQNSTFEVTDYEVKFWDYTVDSWDVWVLTK